MRMRALPTTGSFEPKLNMFRVYTIFGLGSQGTAKHILAERVAVKNRDDHKARDAGRSWDYDAKERNAISADFTATRMGRGFCRRFPSALSPCWRYPRQPERAVPTEVLQEALRVCAPAPDPAPDQSI